VLFRSLRLQGRAPAWAPRARIHARGFIVGAIRAVAVSLPAAGAVAQPAQRLATGGRAPAVPWTAGAALAQRTGRLVRTVAADGAGLRAVARPVRPAVFPRAGPACGHHAGNHQLRRALRTGAAGAGQRPLRARHPPSFLELWLLADQP